MTTTRVSSCLNVRGAIRSLQSQRSKKPGFQHDDGRPMNKADAMDALMDELAKGHEVIPMNPKCGNPCQNSPLCKGFDHGKAGGCPGYAVDDQPSKEEHGNNINTNGRESVEGGGSRAQSTGGLCGPGAAPGVEAPR